MSNCSEIESCFACESCLNDYLRAGLTTRSNIVATLPNGSSVELPAGTVLKEAPTIEATLQENFAALKLMAPSLAGVYERAGTKLGIEPHLVTEEQAYEECPALRPADPLPTKPRT